MSDFTGNLEVIVLDDEHPTLDYWTLHKCSGGYKLIGTIYNDTKGRFVDGTRIVTSALRSIDFTVGIAKTRNTTYNLDKPMWEGL